MRRETGLVQRDLTRWTTNTRRSTPCIHLTIRRFASALGGEIPIVEPGLAALGVPSLAADRHPVGHRPPPAFDCGVSTNKKPPRSRVRFHVWWSQADRTADPQHCQCCALPTELWPQIEDGEHYESARLVSGRIRFAKVVRKSGRRKMFGQLLLGVTGAIFFGLGVISVYDPEIPAGWSVYSLPLKTPMRRSQPCTAVWRSPLAQSCSPRPSLRNAQGRPVAPLRDHLLHRRCEAFTVIRELDSTVEVAGSQVGIEMTSSFTSYTWGVWPSKSWSLFLRLSHC